MKYNENPKTLKKNLKETVENKKSTHNPRLGRNTILKNG